MGAPRDSLTICFRSKPAQISRRSSCERLPRVLSRFQNPSEELPPSLSKVQAKHKNTANNIIRSGQPQFKEKNSSNTIVHLSLYHIYICRTLQQMTSGRPALLESPLCGSEKTRNNKKTGGREQQFAIVSAQRRGERHSDENKSRAAHPHEGRTARSAQTAAASCQEVMIHKMRLPQPRRTHTHPPHLLPTSNLLSRTALPQAALLLNEMREDGVLATEQQFAIVSAQRRGERHSDENKSRVAHPHEGRIARSAQTAAASCQEVMIHKMRLPQPRRTHTHPPHLLPTSNLLSRTALPQAALLLKALVHTVETESEALLMRNTKLFHCGAAEGEERREKREGEHKEEHQENTAAQVHTPHWQQGPGDRSKVKEMDPRSLRGYGWAWGSGDRPHRLPTPNNPDVELEPRSIRRAHLAHNEMREDGVLATPPMSSGLSREIRRSASSAAADDIRETRSTGKPFVEQQFAIVSAQRRGERHSDENKSRAAHPHEGRTARSAQTAAASCQEVMIHKMRLPQPRRTHTHPPHLLPTSNLLSRTALPQAALLLFLAVYLEVDQSKGVGVSRNERWASWSRCSWADRAASRSGFTIGLHCPVVSKLVSPMGEHSNNKKKTEVVGGRQTCGRVSVWDCINELTGVDNPLL
eukprot:gene1694-1056_t